MFDVAIIGAGVVGGLLAAKLAEYDLRICLLEKNNDVAMGATRANSAIVHAGFDAAEGTLKAKLNVRGSALMEGVTRALGVKYRRNGSLVVGFSEEDNAALRALYERGVKNGVPELRLLSGEEARALEGALSDQVTGALYAPTGAIVCPYELCIAAVGNAMDNGAELRLNFPVSSVRQTEEGYVLSDGANTVEARAVVNCAGIHADDVAALAGDATLHIHPRRGEYMLLDRECGNLLSHTVFQVPTKMGKGILVTPTVDGNLLVGPTAEDRTDKEDTSTSAAGLARVAQLARKSVPGVPLGKVITSFCGLRAVGSDGDFCIRSPRPHWIDCAGIESPGLSAAPAIAEYVTGMLAEQGMPLKKRETHIATRRAAHWFRELSPEQMNEVIAKDARYARIICRCEKISEGEIVEALHTNPRPTDLDGVKRRTRSGMGRCQGGFCSPYVVELIARECGIPYEDVTKCGGASRINFGRTKGGDHHE